MRLDHVLQAHLFVGGHLGRFHVLAVLGRGAMDPRGQVFERTRVLIPLGCVPRSGIAESCGSSVNFLRKGALKIEGTRLDQEFYFNPERPVPQTSLSQEPFAGPLPRAAALKPQC